MQDVVMIALTALLSAAWLCVELATAPAYDPERGFYRDDDPRPPVG